MMARCNVLQRFFNTKYYLLIAVAVPGLFAKREDFPEHHTKGPNIGLARELAIHDTLGGHPSYWKKCVAANLGNIDFLSFSP